MGYFCPQLSPISHLEKNRDSIAALALERAEENDAFREYLRLRDSEELDQMVHALNESISASIDCTTCGACCRGLMINVAAPEIKVVALRLEISEQDFKDQFIEESAGGQMIMNRIPCSFLSENKCTVYEQRFNECREFPHLHKQNFKGRLFGTLVHYAMCPIIFNVVEQLKVAVGFIGSNRDGLE